MHICIQRKTMDVIDNPYPNQSWSMLIRGGGAELSNRQKQRGADFKP